MAGSLRSLTRAHAQQQSRRPRRFVALLAALACLLVATIAIAANPRTQFLISRLQFPPAAGQADDFRVRTNAALQLGATDDDDAIAPLCAALNDPSDVVRQAVSVALKRLGRASSVDCLSARLDSEPNADVKLQITRAIESIKAATNGGASGGAPANAPNATLYVALSKVTNKTGRPQADIDRIVLGAIRRQAAANGGMQLAPDGESPAAARAVMSKRHLSGYYLSISAEAFDGSGGNLRVVIKVAVFTYPGKDLRGEISPGATLPGAHPGDHGAEDQLMDAVASHIVDVITQTFH